uniref:Glycolate oxidase, subunit GlcD n=1 Tax=uncultured organism TaxID=155900 RepID=M1QC72_9ZZZZ|nr:glycolate oxidase, subunit GlcD [uncultured organism]
MPEDSKYNEVDDTIIDELKNICGSDFVITDRDMMESYTHDELSPAEVEGEYPDILVKPDSSEKVSKIMKLANESLIPVTPIGGRTGLMGGMIPVYGGIGLSLERLNRTIDVDEDNLMVEVDAGVSMEKLYDAVEEKGLTLPIHPTTEDSQVGGTIAANAGGEATLKHGVMRDYVKGLEVVLPDGEIIKIGGKLLKDNTGYSLLHLMIGSEGTLGIITKAVLRLYPSSEQSKFIIVPFESGENAISTVPEIIKSGITPAGIEYLERDTILSGEEKVNESWPTEKGEATLMIIVTGEEEDEILEKAQKIMEICEEKGAIDAFLATKRKEMEKIMKIREGIAEVIQEGNVTGHRSGDLVVPPSKIPEFIKKAREIFEDSQIEGTFYAFGHAGDGNVHLEGKLPDENVDWEKVKELRDRWIQTAIDMGGEITGEHGIGLIKKPELRKFKSPRMIQLMESIKKSFDPNNILNPGKIVSEDEEMEDKYIKI